MKKLILLTILAVFLTGCGSAQPTITDNGKPGQIKVTVFQDDNNNGQMDANEKATAAEMVLLSTGDTCPPQTINFTQKMTDEKGEVLFNNLKPGTYCTGYMGMSSTTTKIAVKVNVSSEETATVYYGIIP